MALRKILYLYLQKYRNEIYPISSISFQHGCILVNTQVLFSRFTKNVSKKVSMPNLKIWRSFFYQVWELHPTLICILYRYGWHGFRFSKRNDFCWSWYDIIFSELWIINCSCTRAKYATDVQRYCIHTILYNTNFVFCTIELSWNSLTK